MKWVLLLAILLAAGPARAQDDDIVQRIYASLESSIRNEYEALLASMPRDLPEHAAAAVEKNRALTKMFAYNKAVLFANCAAEAEKNRPPQATRVPAPQNLMLRTCVEIKIGHLQKFTRRVAYADLFFPERVEACGERSRLPQQEKVLRPFAFLFLDEPKLYDFEQYSECLMTKQGP